MLLSLFLITLLADAPQAQTAPPAFEAAVQMATAGADEDALAAFQQLAAANPNDLQARLWIARLQDRLRRPERSEPVYRSIVLEDPKNIEAILGSGRALLLLDQTDASIEMLERGEELDGSNADVLSALGRAHAVAGHRERSADYYRKAAEAAPTTENKIAYARAALADNDRIEAKYSNEQFSGSTPDSHLGDIAVNLGVSDAWRVFVRGQRQKKFDVVDMRAGAGVTWTWDGAYTLMGQVLAGSSDNTVMPNKDALGELAYTYQNATSSIAVRYFDFNGTTMTVISPAAHMWATGKLLLGARYAVSVTNRPFVEKKEFGHTLQLHGSYQLWPRLAVALGAARGVEDFDNLSLDRVGKFVATTGSAGIRVDLATLTAVAAKYEYQRPHAGRSMGRATISLTQGF
jgi:YaiO family outer membrane protein